MEYDPITLKKTARKDFYIAAIGGVAMSAITFGLAHMGLNYDSVLVGLAAAASGLGTVGAVGALISKGVNNLLEAQRLEIESNNDPSPSHLKLVK